jgi:hypothetical protein
MPVALTSKDLAAIGRSELPAALAAEANRLYDALETRINAVPVAEGDGRH